MTVTENTVIFEATESFDLPAIIVDKYLSVEPVNLRLILFLFRNKNKSFSAKELCKAVSASEDEIDLAFDFWVREGILFDHNGRYTAVRPKVAATDVIKYTSDTVSKRMSQDSGIDFLVKKAEKSLGRPLTPDDISAVISITDWIGLTPDVAALLMDYAFSTGTKSMKKILSTAAKWEENGITTFELADEFVSNMKEISKTENKVASLLGIRGRALSSDEKENFVKWKTEYGFTDEIILIAYDKTINGAKGYNIKYMKTILDNWHAAGITTAEQAKNDKAASSQSKQTKKTKINSDAAIETSWEIIKEFSDGKK